MLAENHAPAIAYVVVAAMHVAAVIYVQRDEGADRYY